MALSQTLIECQNITKSYENTEVLQQINLSIEEGEMIAVIGPNGAGKTTFFETLLGIRQCDSGSIHYWTPSYLKHIGVQLQTTPFFPGLNVIENIKMFAAFYYVKMSKQEIQALLQLCGLQQVEKKEASKLSGGQQKRLAIAIALVHNPKLIFLDEPTAALDPRSRKDIHDMIKALKEQSKTVVFTSHDMDEVTKLANRVIFIQSGQIVAHGSPEQLCQSYEANTLDEVYFYLTRSDLQ